MRMRKIGKTNIEVSPIGLGGWPMSDWRRPSEDDAIRVIHVALESGMNFIDTANAYCKEQGEVGHNERLIKKALASYSGKKPYVATKGGFERPGGDWVTNCKPKNLMAACEKSLIDLGVDSIFLYQLHAPDDDVPYEDSVGALSRLKEQGKIQHVGISNVSADELSRAQKVTSIETVQNRFNLSVQRDLENGVIAACKSQNVTYIAHSPVGGQFLFQDIAKTKSIHDAADKLSVDVYQAMLLWVLSKGDHIIAIPGASKVTSALSSGSVLQMDDEILKDSVFGSISV